jgi:hypothetical protein
MNIMTLTGFNCDETYIRNYTRIKKFLKEFCSELDLDEADDPIISHSHYGYSVVQNFETASLIIILDELTERMAYSFVSHEKFEPIRAIDLLTDYFGGYNFKIEWKLEVDNQD